MKMNFNPPSVVLAGILLGTLAGVSLLAAETGQKIVVVANAEAGDLPAPTPGQKHVLLRTIALDGSKSDAREMTWLGVGVEDASEPLAAQLGLKPGEGLVVSFVASNSPAATAGLQRNDVLVELDGQMLVDRAQLRKLVQMHNDGDTISISFYRAGKKQSVAAKLAKKAFNEASLEGDNLPSGYARLWAGMHDAPVAEKGNMDAEIQRTVEQARQAIQDALRQSPAGPPGQRRLEIIHKRLGNLADGGVNLGKDATVIVKSENETVRTMVKKDETGSYVLVALPAKHLTAHDPDGKLIFDGAIESPEEQQKVPKAVWEKVEPMLEQLSAGKGGGGTAAPESHPEEN